MAIKKFPAAVRMSSALSTTANLAVEAAGTRRDLVKSQCYFFHVFSCLQNRKVTVNVNCDVGEGVTQLNHHKSGNTQLARDVFSLSLLEKILRNP